MLTLDTDWSERDELVHERNTCRSIFMKAFACFINKTHGFDHPTTEKKILTQSISI